MNYHQNFIHIGIWVKMINQKDLLTNKKKLSNDKLVFLKVISNVIKSGMDIVGVDTPQKM